MGRDVRLLYLIRHGATEANLRQPYTLQGQGADLPLCEVGLRQAKAAEAALEHRSMRWIFSSPMRRAMETAQMIAQPHSLPVHPVSELTECDVGCWEGLSWEEIRQRDPESYQAFQLNPATTPYEAGESYQQVQARVVPAIERLLRDHPDGGLAIVTHNIAARGYVAHLLGLHLEQARNIRLDNGGITIVRVQASALRVQELITLNSVFHLDGLMTN